MATNFKAAFNIACLVERRDENNWNRLILMVALQLQCQFETGNLLHHDIHENEIWRLFGHVCPERDEVIGDHNREFGLQQCLNVKALNF